MSSPLVVRKAAEPHAVCCVRAASSIFARTVIVVRVVDGGNIHPVDGARIGGSPVSVSSVVAQRTTIPLRFVPLAYAGSCMRDRNLLSVFVEDRDASDGYIRVVAMYLDVLPRAQHAIVRLLHRTKVAVARKARAVGFGPCLAPSSVHQRSAQIALVGEAHALRLVLALLGAVVAARNRAAEAFAAALE